MEVEILVAEVGVSADGDRLFRIRYDGFVIDEEGSAVLGGDADTISERLKPTLSEGMALGAAVKAAVAALAGERTLTVADLEVAVLARTIERRAFRRVPEDELEGLLEP